MGMKDVQDSAVVAAAAASLCNLDTDNSTVIRALKDSRAVVSTLAALTRRAQEGNLDDGLIKTIADLVGDKNSQVRSLRRALLTSLETRPPSSPMTWASSSQSRTLV